MQPHKDDYCSRSIALLEQIPIPSAPGLLRKDHSLQTGSQSPIIQLFKIFMQREITLHCSRPPLILFIVKNSLKKTSTYQSDLLAKQNCKIYLKTCALETLRTPTQQLTAPPRSQHERDRKWQQKEREEKKRGALFHARIAAAADMEILLRIRGLMLSGHGRRLFTPSILDLPLYPTLFSR